MKHAFFLAYQYLLSTKLRFVILVVCTAIALSLPINTLIAVSVLSEKLVERGESTPVLVGKKGNEFALTMNALYFRGKVKDVIDMGVYQEMSDTYEGTSVPLYIAHSASQTPIVGTNIDYLEARSLSLKDGRLFIGLGEVLVGAQSAIDFNLQVGDNIRSDLQNLYNIAGSYPMTLSVVGILEPAGTADDNVVFADLKTVWALDGLLHGHDEVNASNALNGQSDSENLEATAAIFMFTELTDQNRDGFHLHGSEGDMPLSSVALFPTNQQEQDLLLGRMALSEVLQAVQPVEVIDDILGIVLKLQQGLYLYYAMLILSTGSFYGLVLHLSLQLRAEEMTLIRRIGGSKQVLRNLLFAEIALVSMVSVFITLLFSLAFYSGLHVAMRYLVA